MKSCLTLLLLLFGLLHGIVSAQFRLTGQIADSQDKKPLSFVNIGIKKKNLGTVSGQNGNFRIVIAAGHDNDTLTFSAVGYLDYALPLKGLDPDKPLHIELRQESGMLDDVVVSSKSLKKQQFGIKHRGLLIHFSDGMFSPDDSFEIGQLIHLGDNPVKLTALNLYLLESRPDSAAFRIKFYRYSKGQPGKQLLKKSIIQWHAIKKGWLKFPISSDNIYLSGDVIAALEFLPQNAALQKPINFEVKLGGLSRSFYRRSSLGKWSTPPHHYILNVTALTNADAPQPVDDDIASLPAFVYASTSVKDDFHIFLDLPEGYTSNTTKKYPVLYLLDGNAYFDQVKNELKTYAAKHPRSTLPILVGIGYKNAYFMDSLRVRDYTYPEALPIDSFSTSGGASPFYSFITKELIPHIDSCYHTDSSRRTIMGHSFGGYFALYTLLRESNLAENHQSGFNNFIAASPSINYHDDYIVKKLAQKTRQVNPTFYKGKQLYITMGERELSLHQKLLFQYLTRTLDKQTTLGIKTSVFPDTDHLGTAVPTFKDAIAFLYP